MVNQNDLGIFLKTKLDEQNISIRELSKLVQIDKSTISRIINGKRNPTVQHLEKFSEELDVSFLTLLSLAGYPVNKDTQELSDLQKSVAEIEQTLINTDAMKQLFSIQKLKNILEDLEAYIQTKNGRELLINNFKDKLNKTQGSGPFINSLKSCFNVFINNNGTKKQLIYMGSALLYFVVPIDVIPDYIFPIGYVDDAIALQLVLNNSAFKGGSM